MKTESYARCDCNCIHEDKKDSAVAALERVNVFNEMSQFFKNFADTTRLKIMTALDGAEEMCVCDIAVALDMTKSAISHQLKYLKDCNLIKCKKVGKVVFYSLADKHVKDILEEGIDHVSEGGAR